MLFRSLEMSYHAGLTTVRQHMELSGRIGIEILLRLLDGGTPPPTLLPPPEVIVRQTTRTLDKERLTGRHPLPSPRIQSREE
mgnify:FL=1